MGKYYDEPKQTYSNTEAHSEDILTEEREYWWNDDYLELLANRLHFKDCSKIADIGCGTGTLSFSLSRYFPEAAHISGLDFEKIHIKKAKQQSRKNPGSFYFVQGDAHDIPFADNEMDLTFCQTLLIHIENPAEVLEEMKRITRHDGWIVALEPNNLVNSLMFDNYAQTHYSIPELMKIIEVKLRCEEGKRKLGLGYNSVGDALPDLFQQAGLRDIQVWLSDKALSFIPPYDTREKRVRAAQLIDWLETGKGSFNYERNYRYFHAGGGKKADFNAYWTQWMLFRQELLKQLKEQRYISAGGSLMYIVTGRVEKN